MKIDDWNHQFSKKLTVLLTGRLTNAELAERVKNIEQAESSAGAHIDSVVLDKAKGCVNRTEIESLAMLSGSLFLFMEELTINVPVGAFAKSTNDFAKTSKNLRTLHISSQIVKKLSCFPGNLRSLRTLSLSQTNISTIDSIFKNLPNLGTLQLNDNKLTVIGQSTFMGIPKLRHLYLHNNQIGTIHEKAFLHLNQLETLNLSNNRIKNVNIIALPYSLVSLTISYNPVKDINMLKLGMLLELKTLEIESTEPHLENINASAVVNPISPLKTLNLKSCKITSADHLDVLDLLFPNLRTVDLKGNLELNKLGIVDMKSLQSYRQTHKSSNAWDPIKAFSRILGFK